MAILRLKACQHIKEYGKFFLLMIFSTLSCSSDEKSKNSNTSFKVIKDSTTIKTNRSQYNLDSLPLDSVFNIIFDMKFKKKQEIESAYSDRKKYHLYSKTFVDSIEVMGEYIKDPQIFIAFISENKSNEKIIKIRFVENSKMNENFDILKFKNNGHFQFIDTKNKKEYNFFKSEFKVKDSLFTSGSPFGHYILNYKTIEQNGDIYYYLKFNNFLVESSNSYISEVIFNRDFGIAYLLYSTPYNNYYYFHSSHDTSLYKK